MLDRTIAPPFKTINKVDIIEAKTENLENGIKIHSIHVSGQPVIRMEFIFKAGLSYEKEHERMLSYFTLKMLNEGTKNKTVTQINDFFDGYGSFLELSHGADNITVTVYSLSKHIKQLLPLVQEILFESIFPEHELENLKTITAQNLEVNSEKTSYLASQYFKENLFGKNYPYGKSIQKADILASNQQNITGFYSQNILNKPFDIILSGEIVESDLEYIKKIFSEYKIQKNINLVSAIQIQSSHQRDFIFEKEGSMQSSIRFGKLLFNRTHPDYIPFLVLNEVLGGYFGSRLMMNIREEKGFTYGIQSSTYSLRRDGYLTIGTDVKREYTQQTIDEIIKEIKILQREIIPKEELEKVKNYMLGSFAGGLNSAFAIADHFKMIYFDGLDYNYFKRYIAGILNVSAAELQNLAIKYLQVDSMLEVVVGGK